VSAPRRSAGRSPLILLVEDNEDARRAYGDYFRYCGILMVTAVDGREALDMVARLDPDVIVMDLAMPRMDGWTAIRHLKSRFRSARIPILALSAHATDDDQERAQRAGANVFRAKPCLPHELVAEIKTLLRVRCRPRRRR